MSILIKNTTVLTQDKNRRILKNTDVLVSENIISKIGKFNEKAEFVIDGRDKILMPGFVNTHTHAAMSLFKGFGDDMELNEWLEKKIWPAEAKLTPEYTYFGSLLSIAEMIKTGTTAFNDMYFFMESVSDAAKKACMRVIVCDAVIDFFDEKKAEITKNRTLKLLTYVTGLNDSLIRAATGSHAIYTCSPESIISQKRIADKNKILMHMHVSETQKEVNDCIKKNKMRPVEYLEKLGVLGENVVFAHACYLSKKEIDIVKKHNVKIAHCPVSNMKLATGGVIDWSYMRSKNVCVSLATDGHSSNNNLDMFKEMKMAALLQKHARMDATVMPAQDTLDMATLGGAQALGINAGRIAVGALADIILLDKKDISLVPQNDIVSNIVYSANGSCVDTTIINGSIVMQNRKLTTLDEDKIKEKCIDIAMTLCTD
ncbi:MAG: amidohydrolase [Candidatus Aenigmarchaeota archaeon]|nr:amidohydrolase [Candidatus Aenigmarchaeota archaeon]